MSGLFDVENPVMAFVGKAIDYVYVSVLWIVFCVPIITIGASTTALYYTANKVLRHNRSYVFKEFVKSFKENFPQSTKMFLLVVILSALFYGDIRFMMSLPQTTWTYVAQIFFMGCWIYTMILAMYVFPYVGRFAIKTLPLLKNAVYMSLRHLPQTILMALIVAAAGFALYMLPILALFVPAVAAVFVSVFMEKIFYKYMTEEDKAKEDKLNNI